MSDLISWLRSTITAELEVARAADEAAPGPWVNTGQDGCGDAWQVHGAPTGETEWKYDYDTEEDREVPVLYRIATLNYDDSGGVWKREAADHIVLQQPRDTIARCEAELALLDRCAQVMSSPETYTDVARFFAGEVLERLASGYRHRPGYPHESAA